MNTYNSSTTELYPQTKTLQWQTWLVRFRISALGISWLRPTCSFWKSDKNPFLVSGRVCCFVTPPPPPPLAVWPWESNQPAGQGGAALVCSYWTLSLAHIVKWSRIEWTGDLSSPDKPPGNNSWPWCLKEKKGKDDPSVKRKYSEMYQKMSLHRGEDLLAHLSSFTKIDGLETFIRTIFKVGFLSPQRCQYWKGLVVQGHHRHWWGVTSETMSCWGEWWGASWKGGVNSCQRLQLHFTHQIIYRADTSQLYTTFHTAKAHEPCLRPRFHLHLVILSLWLRYNIQDNVNTVFIASWGVNENKNVHPLPFFFFSLLLPFSHCILHVTVNLNVSLSVSGIT